MTDPIVKFVASTLNCRSTIDNIFGGGVQKADVEAYAQAKFEMMEAAAKAAESWMANGLDSPGAKVLLENSGLRTLLGPLQSGYAQLQSQWKEFKQSVPDVTQAEIIMASLMQGDPGAILVEAEQFDQRLSTLPNSKAAKTLFQNEDPDMWAALLKRYSSDSNSVSAKLSGLSGGPRPQ